MSEHKYTVQNAPTNAAVGWLAALATKFEVQTIEGRPHLINPITGEVKNLEGLLARPLRNPTVRNLATVDGFIEYVKRFKNGDSSIYVTADVGGFSILCELDHRSETQLVWDDHKAGFTLRHSEPLKRWLEFNKKAMSQAKFADLLEERALEIKTPAAAEILELAQNLHVTRNLSVKSLIRGSRASNSIAFNQDQSLKAGADGSLDLPTSFIIEVEPFARHRNTTQIKALLRPRIEDDKPVFTFELQLIDEAIDTTLTEILHGIESQTSLPVYR